MKVAEVLNEVELIELARSDSTTIGQVFEKLAKAEAEEMLRGIEKAPKFNPVDGVEDIRFKMGARRGVLKVLAWRQEAVEALNKSNRQGVGQ